MIGLGLEVGLGRFKDFSGQCSPPIERNLKRVISKTCLILTFIEKTILIRFCFNRTCLESSAKKLKVCQNKKYITLSAKFIKIIGQCFFQNI